jgi:hypothetical protein
LNGSNTYYAVGKVSVGTSASNSMFTVSTTDGFMADFKSINNWSMLQLFQGNTVRTQIGYTDNTGMVSSALSGSTFINSPTGLHLTANGDALKGITVIPGGNVGIGNITPTEALEVTGNIKANSIKFADGSIQSSAKTDCLGRYEDNSDGTITDCRTGLIWLKNAGCTATLGGVIPTVLQGKPEISSSSSATWASGLGNTFCGLTDNSLPGDWRLPTKTEFMAMVNDARKKGFVSPALTNKAGTGQWLAGDLFDNVYSGNYLTSSHITVDVATINMANGITSTSGNSGTVWPVRAGR